MKWRHHDKNIYERLNHVTYRDLRCTLELVPSVMCLKFFLKPRNLSHEMAVNMVTTMGIHYLYL